MMTIRIFLLMLPICTAAAGPAPAPAPEPPREFRAAWVATVRNIDWPSSRDLAGDVQREELRTMIDTAHRIGLNALILQIRPMADALYPSELEPWSEFLTGKMGRPPEPLWDPLAFAIDECHRRGMELHVWFNPYRAREPNARGPASATHVSKARPEIVREYGTHDWMDPAEEATKRHTLDVVIDVVRRYDVDGVHLDDYFYPYPSYADGADFPDDAAWSRYVEGGGKLSRADWRRWHVDDFVKRFYDEVKLADPLVKVGISPFGIWRPGHPEGIRGLDQHNVLFADARRWLNEGWVDYFTPQLYWELAREAQSYPRLLEWWIGENRHGRHVWPGNFTSRIRASDGWPPTEILEQIDITRRTDGASGNVHFSMIALMQNRQGIADQLREGPYATPALVPASPWLAETAPAAPVAELRDDGTLVWRAGCDVVVRQWVVQAWDGTEWTTGISGNHPQVARERRAIAGERSWSVVAIDRAGVASPPTVVVVAGDGR